ncbi:MAG: amidohydrolase family protein, partial [Pseudomonadota bacterium]
GEWLMVPEALEEAVRVYWQRGFQIHVHVCGDLGVELVVDILAKMQAEHPRFDHGFTFEHFGFCNHEQIRRIHALGGQISANIYYLHELSDAYSRTGIGHARASEMARVGSAMRAGLNVAFHSDFTMAPAEPLNSAWVAVNRLAHTGEVMCAEECVTAEQALAAITINAARVLNMADRVGSLHPGKMADFTVLADDPLEVDPLALRDIPVVATVFEGRVYPVG